MWLTRWTAARLRQLGWSIAMVALMVLGLGVGTTLVVGLLLTPLTVGQPLAVWSLRSLRWLADLHRLWSVRVMDRPITRPYRHEISRAGTYRQQLARLLSDPATRGDIRWLGADLTVGPVTGGLPAFAAGSILTGAGLLVQTATRGPMVQNEAVPEHVLPNGLGTGFPSPELLHEQATHQLVLVLGIGSLALFALVFLSGYAMRAYTWLLEATLGPARSDRLAARVDELTRSRDEVVDTQSAEVRRIERDLHDGAQARLVALGMNLGMAEKLLDADPEAARALLGEAKRSTGEALSELRTLVRGIHPPILADRGLEGAVRALAMSSAIPVELTIDLPGRVPAPVESAVYFALTEIMANMAKHSGAANAWIRLVHADGRLDVMVSDDGRGGATVTPGGGLHGIERRLAAFDGTVFVASPIGGPTIVSMGVPCEQAYALS